MATEISNYDDIIDSRDVIERIDELEAIEVIDREPEEQEELDALYALAEQSEGYAPDWQYGETLIRDSYFQEYARQLAEDIGAIPDDLPNWVVIDWEETADNLLVDYTSVEFDGVTYWVR
jgi:hypothetical protein